MSDYETNAYRVNYETKVVLGESAMHFYGLDVLLVDLPVIHSTKSSVAFVSSPLDYMSDGDMRFEVPSLRATVFPHGPHLESQRSEPKFRLGLMAYIDLPVPEECSYDKYFFEAAFEPNLLRLGVGDLRSNSDRGWYNWSKTFNLNDQYMRIANYPPQELKEDDAFKKGIFISNYCNYPQQSSVNGLELAPSLGSADEYKETFLNFAKVVLAARQASAPVAQEIHERLKVKPSPNARLEKQVRGIVAELKSGKKTSHVENIGSVKQREPAPDILKVTYQRPRIVYDANPRDSLEKPVADKNVVVRKASRSQGSYQTQDKPNSVESIPKQLDRIVAAPASKFVFDKKPQFNIDQIGGHEQIKQQLEEIALLFKNPDVVADYGTEQPAGILLHGEPGNGKTMFAHALANMTESTLWEVNTAQLIGKWLGESTKNLSSLFDNIVRHKGKLMVLFEEIDGILSITPTPDAGGGASSERNQFASFFKQRLNDLFNAKENLLVVATTNNIDSIDQSLIRDGRFDYKIAVPSPDKDGRAQIIASQIFDIISKHPDEKLYFDVPTLADMTEDMTGAAIQNIFKRVKRRKALAKIRTKQDRPIVQKDLVDEIIAYRTKG